MNTPQKVMLSLHLHTGETGRATGPGSQHLAPPRIKLAGIDPVLARDPRQGDMRRQALLHDRLLLFPRPATPPLNPGDHLDPGGTSGHTSARMTTCMCARGGGRRQIVVHRRVVQVHHHDTRTSRDREHKQCDGETTLTNNIVEQDHRRIKRLTRPGLDFGGFWTARRTLAGMEAMAMVRKGQVRNISGSDIRGQAFFIAELFRIAA